MMPTMRSVLVAAWVGSTNLGDELVFASLLRKLRARNVDVCAVSTNARATERDHDARAIDHRDPIALVRTLSSVDAVVFGGGGLLQNSTSPFNLPYHLARPVVARLRHRAVAAIGIGVGPLEGAIARTLVRRGLHGVRPITVRDSESQTILDDLGIAATSTADLAFGLDPPRSGEPDRLVACLRPWTGRQHFLPVGAREDGTPDWFVPAAARALDRASAALGAPVHFVALQRNRDHPLHERVAARMQSVVSLATPSVHDVVDEIARGVVVVSMRYHGVVAATLAGRPSVAIGYSPKVAALAGELGSAARLVSWSVDGLGAIDGAVRDVMDHADIATRAREQLRARERGNDVALDELLTR